MSAPAYSYRDDSRVPRFDDSRPIVIFDGLCVLCSGGVQWMLRRDPAGTTRFAVIQDAVPRALYAHYGLDADRFDTFMVLADGRMHIKWQGVLAAARTMPQPWRMLAYAGRLVPQPIGDRLYDVVQRKRIAWFGARATCYRPVDSDRARFLDPAMLTSSAPPSLRPR
jgi:predicted DCC family thiol-disulfide oxidoreductase YuxK